MPVYVDPLISWPSKAKTPHCFKDKPSCHMYADTPAELHALAARIGLKREWFQDHRVVGHYDLTPAASSMDGPGTRYSMLRVTLCRRLVISVDGEELSPDERESLARRDGFEDWTSFVTYWTPRIPFCGDIIHWSRSAARTTGER